MKNLKTIFTILASVLLFASCIKEDLSDCPQNNLTLKLHYLGDTQNPAMFGQMIDRVTMFVFNESGQEVQTQVFEKAGLASQSVDLMLPEGQTYRIVCWANAFDATAITRGAERKDYRVNHPNYDTAGAAIPTNDHLYTSDEISVTIPATGVATGDVYFKGAHNNLEIYVDNFGQKNDSKTYPIVEVSNLMPQYDLEMNPKQTATHTYYPKTALDAAHDMLAAKLQTLQFDNDNPVVITIKDPATGAVRATLDLKDYMAANSFSVDGKNERTIVVQFGFTDLGVTITVPEWAIIGIRP